MENCLNTIENSLVHKTGISEKQPNQSHLKSVSKRNESCQNIETVHCVSLDKMKKETEREKESELSKIDIVPNSQELSTTKYYEVKKVEMVSTQEPESVNEHAVMPQTTVLSNNAEHKTQKICHLNGVQPNLTDEFTAQFCLNDRPKHVDSNDNKQLGSTKINHKKTRSVVLRTINMENVNSRTVPMALDYVSKLGKANGIPSGQFQEFCNVQTRSEITINDENYIELHYPTSKNNPKLSQRENGNIPNGIHSRMEDSPSQKYGGRGS